MLWVNLVVLVLILEIRASDQACGGRGLTRSSSGLTCLTWTNTSRDYDITQYPDSLTGVGDHSYCRNPDSSPSPWCYVLDPHGAPQREDCPVKPCRDQTTAAPSTSSSSTLRLGGSRGSDRKPMVGLSQRVQTGPKKKKDLGPAGTVLAVVLMVSIIVLGVSITVGYFYKRGRDLKRQHEQRVEERELQRITLPLSAFSNPTCELQDENAIVITAPLQDGDPLMEPPAGTPGA